MTWTSGPWDGSSFAEDEWSALFSQAIGSKLLDIGSITPSASNRTVSWSGAKAVINGMYAEMTASEVFDFPVPAGSNKRIDYLILKYDPSQVAIADKIKAEMKLGVAALNPSAPALTQVVGGVWEMPIYRIGPWGPGTAAAAPRQEFRNYRTVVRGGIDVASLYGQGNELGDVGFTSDNIYRHDGDSWIPYLGDPNPSQMFTNSDSGYPRSVSSRAQDLITTNQLTVPSASWARILKISCSHYLAVNAGVNQYDSVLLFGNNNAPVRRSGHPTDVDSLLRTNVPLETVTLLAANQSLRLRLGFLQVGDSGTGNTAISSASTLYNNINVHATPA